MIPLVTSVLRDPKVAKPAVSNERRWPWHASSWADGTNLQWSRTEAATTSSEDIAYHGKEDLSLGTRVRPRALPSRAASGIQRSKPSRSAPGIRICRQLPRRLANAHCQVGFGQKAVHRVREGRGLVLDGQVAPAAPPGRPRSPRHQHGREDGLPCGHGLNDFETGAAVQ